MIKIFSERFPCFAVLCWLVISFTVTIILPQLTCEYSKPCENITPTVYESLSRTPAKRENHYCGEGTITGKYMLLP